MWETYYRTKTKARFMLRFTTFYEDVKFDCEVARQRAIHIKPEILRRKKLLKDLGFVAPPLEGGFGVASGLGWTRAEGVGLALITHFTGRHKKIPGRSPPGDLG